MTILWLALLSLTPAGEHQQEPREALARVYEAVVIEDGQVDYRRLKQDEQLMADLQSYADYLAEVDLDAIKDKNARIALLSNAYNVFTLIGVTDAWPVASVRKIRPLFGFFKKTEFGLAGGNLTLDTLENELLRPLDNRIHFLINCASGSCPVLVKEVFTADNVTRIMDENLARFLQDPTKNRFDTSAGVWHLSKIFDWFAADFGGKEGVIAFIRAARPDLDEPKKVRYLDYDWSLNGPTTK